MKIFFIKLAQIIAIITGSFLLTLGYVYGVGYADVYISKEILNIPFELDLIVYIIPILAAYFSAKVIKPSTYNLLILKQFVGISVLFFLFANSVYQLKWLGVYKRFSGFSESVIYLDIQNKSNNPIKTAELSFLWKTHSIDNINYNLRIYIPKGFEGDYYLTLNFESGKSIKQKIGYASYGPKFEHEIEVYDNKINVTEKKR